MSTYTENDKHEKKKKLRYHQICYQYQHHHIFKENDGLFHKVLRKYEIFVVNETKHAFDRAETEIAYCMSLALAAKVTYLLSSGPLFPKIFAPFILKMR